MNVKTSEKSAFIKACGQARTSSKISILQRIIAQTSLSEPKKNATGKKDFELSKLGLSIVWILVLKHLLVLDGKETCHELVSDLLHIWPVRKYQALAV